jgi:hypothetical protein
MPNLCKAGQQLREQIDDDYPDRSRKSDGWIGDARHSARPSDHNPDENGIVRALDITSDLGSHPEEAHSLVEKIRKCAKRGDKRIKYLIFDGRIASGTLNWKWRKYRGINPHRSHFHCSFTTLGDNDGSWFDLEGERHNEKRSKKGSRKLGKDISSDSSSDLPSGGIRHRSDCQCSCDQRNPIDNQLAKSKLREIR